jgi:hypothetical protein
LCQTSKSFLEVRESKFRVNPRAFVKLQEKNVLPVFCIAILKMAIRKTGRKLCGSVFSRFYELPFSPSALKRARDREQQEKFSPSFMYCLFCTAISFLPWYRKSQQNMVFFTPPIERYKNCKQYLLRRIAS